MPPNRSLSRLRSVDFYKKIPSDLTEATLTGAWLSIAASIIMSTLLVLVSRLAAEWVRMIAILALAYASVAWTYLWRAGNQRMAAACVVAGVWRSTLTACYLLDCARSLQQQCVGSCTLRACLGLQPLSRSQILRCPYGESGQPQAAAAVVPQQGLSVQLT